MLTEQFYEFMKERELIRLRRLCDLPREEWTQDPIFKTYKFTNVKRANDWTTQQLLKKFYSVATDAHSTQLLMNCAIARYLGLAESVIELQFQWDVANFPGYLRALVADRTKRRENVFTGAYIVPNGGSYLPKHEVVIKVVCDVYDLATTLDITQLTFQELTESLCTINCVGSFMAKEVLLDFRLVCPEWQPSDWETWTPVGPGARRGAARVASDDGTLLQPLSEPKALAVCRELYALRHDHWPKWQTIIDSNDMVIRIPVPELELCDIQFQLCEFDKYLRVKLEGRRAKTLFKPRQD